MQSRSFAVAGGACFIVGAVFAVLFIAGAFRNVAPQVQPLADINNYLLPLWLMVLGGAMIRAARRLPGDLLEH